MRFDVVNVFDEIYEIRSGSGIGVFRASIRTAPGVLLRHFATNMRGGPDRADRLKSGQDAAA
jgi:hypothetical protein